MSTNAYCSMKVEINSFVDRLEQLKHIDIIKPVKEAARFVQGEARAGAPADTGELRRKIIVLEPEVDRDTVRIAIQSDVSYGVYVEMGTGQIGAENHQGISPDAIPVYTISPWWIHEGPEDNEVDRETAERYHWPYIETDQGRFYLCTGQRAHPYMYPALHDNEEKVQEIIRNGIRKQIRK